MLRFAFLAATLVVSSAVAVSASPVSFQGQTEILFDTDEVNDPSSSFLGQDIFGNWVISSDFSDGTDENVGIPSPTYDVQITFDNGSVPLPLSTGEVRLPGTTTQLGGISFETTALFYQDDVAIDATGTPYAGLVSTGIYDMFELNAANTIGLQDPNTGEFSPAAPVGENEAGELTLTILADASWFSGAPTSILTLPSTFVAVIGYTEYNQAGLQTRSFGGVTNQDNAGAGSVMAPVPLPAAGWLLVAGLGGLAMVRRRARA